MLSLPPEVDRRLRRIPWFEACGSAFDLFPGIKQQIESVDSWQAAARCCVEDTWEHATAEAQAALTVRLTEKFPSEAVQWNALAHAARALVRREVGPAIDRVMSEHHLPKAFRDCVEWDVLHALMEEAYAAQVPSAFFRQLLIIYEAGHWPCGWVGEWPAGKLLVL